jgi:hypothetical protein
MRKMKQENRLVIQKYADPTAKEGVDGGNSMVKLNAATVDLTSVPESVAL